jgi:uncharacterized protein YceK
MAFRAIRVALLLSTLPLAGCGTVANLARQQPGAGGVVPFGGVREDMNCIQKASNGEVVFRTHHRSDSEQYPRRALVLFCAADLPLSFVGDIVTWPYTVTYSYINQPIPTPPVLIANPPPGEPVMPPPAPSDAAPAPLPLPTGGQPMPIPIPPVPQPAPGGKLPSIP